MDNDANKSFYYIKMIVKWEVGQVLSLHLNIAVPVNIISLMIVPDVLHLLIVFEFVLRYPNVQLGVVFKCFFVAFNFFCEFRFSPSFYPF